MNDNLATEQAALDWQAQVQAGSVDWDAFTRWLEADRDHADAYDAVALSDALMADHRGALATVSQPSHRFWAWGTSGVLAASLAVAAWLGAPHAPAIDIHETQASVEQIALADGTHIALAPHSRLERDGTAMVLRGDAVFDVPHRPGREMVITAAGLKISDIGTRFEIRAAPDTARLTVTEGEVAVTGASLAQPVMLVAGRALLYEAGPARLSVAAAVPGAVGDWQSGHLTYRDAPLGLVVADLTRYGPQQVRMDAALATRRFSGTLLIDHGHAPARDLAQLMGLALRPDGDGDRLLPAGQR